LTTPGDLTTGKSKCIQVVTNNYLATRYYEFSDDGLTFYYIPYNSPVIKKYTLTEEWNLDSKVDTGDDGAIPVGINMKAHRFSPDKQKMWYAVGTDLIEGSYWNPLG
jgi:hypothetical protein